ncbi:hypothetical protein [Marinobacterium rhizophilum]|uniref:Uncharacterized protein n=1 Tax=Marinobacterium rhizophilum TaxID=420402 RepID=A0ABY5HKY2_9GAMM|nr:hypothetical protein [Marinobacterium rhizophilum]UTW11897.1 hypothetical protein KDW95_22090 [Marinobacterium rhizophilum]
MSSLLNNPAIQSSLLPLLLALGLTGLIRAAFGPQLGGRLACAAIAMGFMASLVLIQAPVFPPRSASQKLPYLVVIALALGLVLDSLNLRARAVSMAGILLSLGALGWLLGSRIDRIDLAGWALILVLMAFALLANWRITAAADRIDGSIMLLLASGGVGAISLVGASASIAQTGFAMMAACGGFVLWNWPRLRFALGASASCVLITALVALCAQLLFFTQASGWALLMLSPLLLIDRLQAQLPGLKNITHPGPRALCLTVLGALICAMAIAVALLSGSPSASGY